MKNALLVNNIYMYSSALMTLLYYVILQLMLPLGPLGRLFVLISLSSLFKAATVSRSPDT